MNFKKILLLGVIFFIIYNFFGLFGCLTLILIYFIFFYVYHRKYHIRVFAGLTGAGKTLLANHIVQKYITKNKKIEKKNRKLNFVKYNKYNIYSTFYIDGAFVLPDNFYDYQYPKNSILIIDEAQVFLDSREHSKLVKMGVSNKLKAMLSMHRHHKLDIYFITQNPAEIDAQIRRYNTDFMYVQNTVMFRKFFDFVDKKLKLNIRAVPILVKYEAWPTISDYQRWYNSNDLSLRPRDCGAKTKFAIITSKDYMTYNTNQDDTFYASLPKIQNVLHLDPNSLINIGSSKQ